MLTEVLEAALTKEQRQAGLYLEEDDDHCLALYRGDKLAALFTIHATVKAIRDEADRLMKTE